MCLDPATLTVMATSLAGGGTTAAGATAATGAAAGLTGLQTASLIASGVGAGLSAFSSYSQGKYNARVAQNNALQADWAAEDAIERGRTEEMRHRLKVSQLKGEQRAGTASRGFGVESGSAIDQLADTAEFGEMDALIIRNNYQREAVGYSNQAAGYRAEAKAAKSAGILGAAGSLLSGGARVADTWYQYKK